MQVTSVLFVSDASVLLAGGSLSPFWFFLTGFDRDFYGRGAGVGDGALLVARLLGGPGERQ
jgi:hypothetical protein